MHFGRPACAVLFVCTANICRSPMAQALLARRVGELGVGRRVRIDSAGIRVGMPGQRPDPRAQSQLLKLGMKMKGFRSRQVQARDFERFDYILAMDEDHLAWLREQAGENSPAQVVSIMQFAAGSPHTEVPDPYHGKEAGFVEVLELLQAGIDGFTAAVLVPELRARGLLADGEAQ